LRAFYRFNPISIIDAFLLAERTEKALKSISGLMGNGEACSREKIAAFRLVFSIIRPRGSKLKPKRSARYTERVLGQARSILRNYQGGVSLRPRVFSRHGEEKERERERKRDRPFFQVSLYQRALAFPFTRRAPAEGPLTFSGQRGFNGSTRFSPRCALSHPLSFLLIGTCSVIAFFSPRENVEEM